MPSDITAGTDLVDRVYGCLLLAPVVLFFLLVLLGVLSCVVDLALHFYGAY